MNFGLFYSLFSHNKDVRTLDYCKGILMSGGLDNNVVFYQKVAGKFKQVARCNIFESYIYCVKINPYVNTGNKFLVGCKDSKIYILNHQGNPTKVIEGHTGPVNSISFLNGDQFVSGSWDSTAIVWSISQGTKLMTLTGHQHAVSVLAIGNYVITGSQDKALNLWDLTTGKLIKRETNAHDDIIRQISILPGIGIITCSNDQTVKIWTIDLQHINTLKGHTSFIFTVKATQKGKYFSGSDDKTVRIWQNNKCEQILSMPASVWTLIVDEIGDVIVGLQDSTIRVFSLQPGNRATADELSQYQNQCLKATSKKSGMSVDQIVQLPSIQKMAIHPGKKQGQVKVFRNGNIPQAYLWKINRWQIIGEVITQANQSNLQSNNQQRKYYQGDQFFQPGEYDHLFSVQNQGGVRTKIIPFNNGDNALQAAQKYCKRQGINRGYIEQVRKFLSTNSSNIPTPKNNIQSLQQKNTALPNNTIIQFQGLANSTGLKNKLFEFNQKLSHPFKLNESEKVHIQRIVGLLENVNLYHSWKLDFKQMDTIKKLLKWPIQLKLPVLDLLRAFLKHYQSQSLFSGLDLGADILGPLCLACRQPKTPENICGVILKIFTNMFIQNTNSRSMLTHGIGVIQSIKFLHAKGFNSQAILIGFRSAILNYSISVTTKKINPPQYQLLNKLIELIKLRLSVDGIQESVTIYLSALGNIIICYPQLKQNARFLSFYPKTQVGQELQNLLT